MSTWQISREGSRLEGRGHQDLLSLPMTGFFASRQCPGVAIRAAVDWAMQQAHLKQVVISGFHSPLEQSVLKVLLVARSPVVAVLARPVQKAKLPKAWLAALTNGHMAVVSGVASAGRLTQQLATDRNALVARLAERLVIGYASPDGALATQLAQWLQTDRPVRVL